MNTGFYSIFKDKLNKLKADLKFELEKSKSERQRERIKQIVKECKSLQKAVKEMEKTMDIKTICPHCGGNL